MRFNIKSVILWPKNENLDIRFIRFNNEKVNVITGDSERGKSAIISIIDYCLASSKCSIPTGYIRNLTAWFGIIVEIESIEILFVRKEPGSELVSNDMFVQESRKIIIPEVIEPNCNRKDAINILNQKSNLTKIDFSFEENQNGFNKSASFRDLISLCFQPQHIVANPYALYYKADTYQNKEKLITIFPYILGAIDDKILELKEELKVLKKRESHLSKEFQHKEKIVENWISEIRNYYEIAVEFGLIDDTEFESRDYTYKQYIKRLEVATNNLNNDRLPILGKGVTAKIAQKQTYLKEQENLLAQNIQEEKEKLTLIQNIKEATNDYGNAILTQRQRLQPSSWFLKNIETEVTCPFCGSDHHSSKDYISNLESVKFQLNNLSNNVSDSHKVFGREISIIKDKLYELEDGINKNRKEQRQLNNENEELKNQRLTLKNIYRFGGKLEEAINNYKETSDNSGLKDELDGVRERIKKINLKVNEKHINDKLDTILDSINSNVSHYANILKAEYASESISLDIKNLTVKFKSGSGREDYLWEIGSGHNFMSYHLAVMLGIHEFLLSLSSNKVPSLLIFDQPSQVYFPELKKDNDITKEDLNRVEKIFKALAEFKKRTKSQTQIIILEHAGEYAWQNYKEEVKMVKRWRDDEKDKALIPQSWIDYSKGKINDIE